MVDMTEMRNERDGATLVWVPAGTFVMGRSKAQIDQLWTAYGWDEDWIRGQVGTDKYVGELHPHDVFVDGFCMYREPVTIGQYYQFMQATGHDAPVDAHIHGPWNSAWQDGKPRLDTEALPVSSLSWEDATAYCRWAGGQLPTEAQWDSAACGPANNTFPWGDTWTSGICRCAEDVAGRLFHTNDAWRMWISGMSSRQADGTYPVVCWLGQHVAQIDGPELVEHYPRDVSWCGVRGMAGHVREWCADWYDPDYYLVSPRANPPGPAQPRVEVDLPPCRVLRGGAWNGPAYQCRGSQRLYYLADSRNTNDHGVRPVFVPH